MIVTIVTPTLNAARFLPECIRSVERNRRSGLAVDHVVVDPGSTDGTIEIAKAAGVRLIQGKDKGIFDAINKGSFHAPGDIVGFLGADDLMLPGALDRIVEAFERSRRSWVVGGIRWIDEAGESLGDLAAPPAWITPRMHASLGWNPIMHMSTYITRDLFNELGGFNIDFKDAGDYELFLRILSRTPYERISEPLTCFRRTGENNSVVNAARSKVESRSIADGYGPPSRWERLIWRTALRAWFNLRNPGWSSRKAISSVQALFDPSSPRYF